MIAEEPSPERVPGLAPIDRIEEVCSDYHVMPATAEDVEWAAGLATRVYSGLDVIPREVMLDWFEANPHGFSILKSLAGDRVGNLDILPIRPNTLRRLVAGGMLERDMTGDCLFGDTEKDRIQALYIESFVVDPSTARSAPQIIIQVLSTFHDTVARICDPSQVSAIYAIAASAEGSGLLTRLGFEAIGKSDERRDGHQLYLGSMDAVADGIRQLLGRRINRSPAGPPFRTLASAADPVQQPAVAPSDEAAGLRPELASVFFTDIVGFTRLNPSQQLNARQELESMVMTAEAFIEARATQTMVARPTGDGMALVFFDHPWVAAECAIQIARMLRGRQFSVRMGLNHGTVYRVKDINGQVDVSGSGINMAQRVMDCGDAGHILASASMANALMGTVDWHEFIRPIGRRKIKHGGQIEIFNLCGKDFGRPQPPTPKFKPVGKKRPAEAVGEKAGERA